MTTIDRNVTGRRAAYTIKEVCALTGLGRDGVYRAINEGRLRARKFGKRTLVLDPDLHGFLESLPALGAATNPLKSTDCADVPFWRQR
jgi:excisionase family DNA binding protein